MSSRRTQKKQAVRVELFDDEIEALSLFDPLTGEIIQRVPRYTVFPRHITLRHASVCFQSWTISKKNFKIA